MTTTILVVSGIWSLFWMIAILVFLGDIKDLLKDIRKTTQSNTKGNQQ